MSKYQDVVKDLDRVKEQIEEYRERVSSPGISQPGNWIQSKSGDVSDPTGEAVVRLSELEYKRLVLLGEWLTLRGTIVDVIMEMNGADNIQFMFLRYLHGKFFREISEEMEFTISHLFTIKKRALKEFNRAYQELQDPDQ